MKTLEQLNGGVIEHAGMKFSLTMSDMAVIQGQIPIKDEFKPFVGLTEVMKFCASPQGIQIALQQAGRKFKADLTISFLDQEIANYQQLALVCELVSIFMGTTNDIDGEDAGSEAGEQRVPLADKSGTGS